MGWKKRVRQQLMASLQRLAFRIVDNTRLQGAQALRMTISIPILGQQCLLARLLISTGFEAGELASRKSAILRFLDNIWVWLLTWTYNPRALVGWRFNRTRAEFWMSRARCLALYGDGTTIGLDQENVLDSGKTQPSARRYFWRLGIRPKMRSLAMRTGSPLSGASPCPKWTFGPRH